MSLRLRLTLIYTIFLAVVLGVAAVVVYTITQSSLWDSSSERLGQTKQEIQSKGLDGVQSLSSDVYFAYGYLSGPPQNWQDLKVYFPLDGRSHGHVNPYNFGYENPEKASLFQNLTDGDYKKLYRNGSVITQVSTSSRTWIVEAWEGSVNLAIFSQPTVFLTAIPFPADTLTQLRYDLFRTVLSAFLIFAVGVWLLSRRVLLPVKRVTQAAARVSGQDLAQRVPVPRTHDEVAELAVTLNHMLGRLQESFETQRRFTADASHELRTPVTAITGHASYLLRRTKPTPEQTDSLTVIRREGERMTKLVNDLLELARADAGFLVEKKPVNLVEILEAVHMEVAPVAGNADVKVQSRQSRVEVLGDEGRLKQVLLNLVNNALNAGAKTITLALVKEKQQARLEVLDDGPGIPPEALPHLFDRFYRVDGARSTRAGGSGLGLAIVKWIVQQHDGEVQVESKVGEGTAFTVLLPLLKQAELKAPAPPQSQTHPAKA
jgi:heavy metal sensor kinase